MGVKSRLPRIAAEIAPLVQQALEVGAESVANAAKNRVPVATGGLRDSIHTDRRAEGVYVVAGDTDTFYGHLVEFGTTQTGPRPFLVPALEERREEIRETVAIALRGL